MCAGSRVPVLPARTSGRRVQNSTRKSEVADDIMNSASALFHVIIRMCNQCGREEVHCDVTMETLPDWVPMLPVENYPDTIPEENATRLSPSCCCGGGGGGGGGGLEVAILPFLSLFGS